MNFATALRWMKRFEALLWIALRKAANGNLAFIAARNRAQSANGAPIGAAQTIQFSSASFTSKTGKVQVSAWIYVQSSAVDDALGFQLLRDTVTVITPNAAGVSQDAGHVNKDASVMMAWEDTVTPGSAHTWQIQATNNTGGHTVTVLAAGEAAIQLRDLPA